VVISEQETSLYNAIAEEDVPEEHVKRVHAFIDRLVGTGVPRQLIEKRYYLINSHVMVNQAEMAEWRQRVDEYNAAMPKDLDQDAYFEYWEGSPEQPEYQYADVTIPKARVRFLMPQALADRWNQARTYEQFTGNRYYTYYYLSNTHKWTISDNSNYFPPKVNKKGPYLECWAHNTIHEQIEEGHAHYVAGTECTLTRPQKCKVHYYVLADEVHEHVWKDEGYSRYERVWEEDGVKYYRQWAREDQEPMDMKYLWHGEDEDDYEDERDEEDPDDD